MIHASILKNAPSRRTVLAGMASIATAATIAEAAHVDMAGTRPFGRSLQRTVFGVYIHNDTMARRFRAGELILASTDMEPIAGDCVVVEMKPQPGETIGPGYVKQLVSRTLTHTVVAQYNPPKEITFDNREIKKIYRVLKAQDLLVG